MNNKQLDTFCIDYAKTVEDWAKQNIYSDFTLTVKLDWSPTRRSCRGGMYAGGPGINMAMVNLYPNNAGEIYRFSEYPSYDSCSVIGGFYSRDPLHKTKALLLHEIAHALQFFAYKKNNTRCKPHGPMFKNFYKRLRVAFLNHSIPSQLELKKDYEAYKHKVNSRNTDLLRQTILANS